jgi:hypothetical protein
MKTIAYVVALTALATTLHGDCTPQFRTTALSFGTGLVTGAARLADINGDGHLDVLITNNSIPNPSDAQVWVLTGRGDGTFNEAQKFATGPSPYAAVPADLNGDGVIDVVTPLGGAGNSGVSILLGRGDGTFGAATRYTFGNSTGHAEVVDVNHDGAPDVLTTSYYTGEIYVLLNRGDGTFGTPRAFQQTETAETMSTADFDGDGNIDAVTGHWYCNCLELLRGHGDGTFAAPVRLEVGPNSFSVVTADFDHDGDIDIAAVNDLDSTLSILLNHGEGTFAQQQKYPTEDFAEGAKVADFTGDGILDIAVGNSISHTFSIFVGRGDGTFKRSAPFDGGFNAYLMDAGDLNHDGKVDLAIANAGGLAIALNQTVDCSPDQPRRRRAAH